MSIEIERKFLVNSHQYRTLGVAHKIIQGYICSEKERVVRVRIYDQSAFLTIKDATVGFARHEYEYPIPKVDAEVMLYQICEQPILEKTRYLLEYAGHTWEIDEFKGENEGLVIAEIELESATEKFETPDFIGKEVTNDSRYYNAQLFKHPYQIWKSK